jgi:capsular exopolysaccharide synthesis family protein
MNQITIGSMPRPDYFVQSEIDRLRVNVSFFGTEKKVILLTSSNPNEGKSFIAINLWSELAKVGKRVVFVDADMRKSTLRTTLQLSTGDDEFIGLSHYLAGYAEASDIIYSTDREGVYFIPTSTMINPSLLLDGNRLDVLIKGLRKSFDYVIIDTPPLGIVSDGQMIAGKTDGCILVVRAHETSREAVRSSLQQLRQVDCPVLGVVLNRLEGSRSRGYYTKSYYSSSSNEKKSRRSRENDKWILQEPKEPDPLPAPDLEEILSSELGSDTSSDVTSRYEQF